MIFDIVRYEKSNAQKDFIEKAKNLAKYRSAQKIILLNCQIIM